MTAGQSGDDLLTVIAFPEQATRPSSDPKVASYLIWTSVYIDRLIRIGKFSSIEFIKWIESGSRYPQENNVDARLKHTE